MALRCLSGGNSRVSHGRDKTYPMSSLETEQREAAMPGHFIEANAYCVVA